MFKKTVLAMAIGLMAALALPMSASADWEHHGAPIQQDIQIPFTGWVEFHRPDGTGVKCQVTSTTKFFAGQTTGVAETFDAHPGDETSDCDAQGLLNPCQIHNLTPQAPNWQLHTTSHQTITQLHQNGQTTLGATFDRAVRVTAGTIESQLTGGIFCLVKKLVLHPDIGQHRIGIIEHNGGQDGKTIKEVEVNGSATSTVQTNNGTTHSEEVLITGTLQIHDLAKQTTYDI